MGLFLVAALEILALLAAALAVIGVPLVIGLVAYDLADNRRREAADRAARKVVSAGERRTPTSASTPVSSTRLTA